MTTQTAQVSLTWRLLEQSFRIANCDDHGSTAQLCEAPGEPFLALGDGRVTAIVSTDPASAPNVDPTAPGELWRGISLHHPGVSLPARVLSRLCTAMDAASVPIAMASLPGNTLLLFPANLAGRALAALHQAGIDRITL